MKSISMLMEVVPVMALFLSARGSFFAGPFDPLLVTGQTGEEGRKGKRQNLEGEGERKKRFINSQPYTSTCPPCTKDGTAYVSTYVCSFMN